MRITITHRIDKETLMTRLINDETLLLLLLPLLLMLACLAFASNV